MSVVEALQAALAAEQQAVFGYGLLGPQLSAAARDDARTNEAAHELLRDAAAAAVTQAGQTPVPPQPDYPSLYPVASAKAAIKLATRLENASASAWRFAYAELAAKGASAELRAAAQDALTACAVRATRWRIAGGDPTPTVPFPGI